MYPYYIILLKVFSSLILLIFTTNLVQKSSSTPITLNYNCSNAAFPENSTYGINLSNLFSSLSSKTTLDNNNGLFSDITVTQDGKSNNTVYGQYLCQGDYTRSECNSCVANASTQLALNCPKSISGYIWYEGCTLSFSNENFSYNLSSNHVWLEETNKSVIAGNDTNILAAFIETSMKELADQVAKVDNDVDVIQSSSLGAKYFGTKELNFTVTGRGNTTFYEMVQCTPVVSVLDCSACLTSAVNNELSKRNNGALGGRVGIRSCFIRYEIYRFYKLTEGLELSPSPATISSISSLSKGSNVIKVVIAITIPVSIVLALTIIGVGLFCARKSTSKNALILDMGDAEIDAIESFQYHLSDIKVATNEFSNENKIGQGGFGSVYKGLLQSGQRIAVKKLFLRLGPMEEEFKNEVEVVAKLQHRNLVRLLGYCLAKDAKLLVFEYVPNKSLDKVLFVAEEKAQLDWLTRFKIIVGIARGLLYLHEESRLRIVHRDLKPGNILLDEEMNPKIADFGLARIFGLNQNHRAATNATSLHNHGVDPTHQSTRRGGGTRGYMAPECAERRHFSVKTDVYSFGVLILEIITGKRNSQFQFSGLADDLLSYAWMKWEVGDAMELMDDPLRATLMNEEMNEQAMTCIHIGLLCVQRDSKSRPTMGTIVHKLNYPSDNSLPLPQQPAAVLNSSPSLQFSPSLNECSFSELDDPR